ncbi:hypothetical protein E1267_00735 [Nonomuraea longispora]|uniref:Uncharacterized protein n=1 Tax=Nonomuraea longispora TaxID=1848320 RepID=A0A4V2XLR6_9ACTN|nr:hypothetical protein [Nonomuraea longispora]TDC11496.1 hypothetical protein E1267_00735 [Nonomuraea longispora]
MARARQNRRAKPRRAAPTPRAEQAGPAGRWTAMRTWLAGVLSAVIITAIGVVFTSWFNARGPDTVDRISGEPPIKVGHVAVDHSAQDTALREPVTDPGERAILLGNASGARADAVMARHDRAPLERADATVVLVGNRSSVRVIDIKPRVLTRAPVSDGAVLISTPAGEVDTVELSADLDEPAPRFTAAEDPGTSYFRTKQIDLKRGEKITLSLSVKGTAAYYEFDLQVTALAEDRTEQLTIEGPGGSPFRVTGTAEAYRAYYTVSPLRGWQPISRGEACVIERKIQQIKGC